MQNDNCSHHGVDDDVHGDYPNETIRLLTRRASCRGYLDKAIEPEVMSYLLEAAVRGPSGGNLQPFSIIKIERAKAKRRIAKMCGQSFIGEAPVDLLFCIDWFRLKKWAELEIAPFLATAAFRHFWISFQDTVIAAQNVATAADALGLGSVYIGTVMECIPQLCKMFDLPKGVFPVVLLCLGYPKFDNVPRKKLPADILVHNEKYELPDDTRLTDAFSAKYKGSEKKITKKRLEQIEKVCRRVHDENYAKGCTERTKQNGFINMANHYFGLHYCADEMVDGNDMFLDLMKQCGFDWFEKFKWPGEKGK